MCCEIPELANAAGLRWDRGQDPLYTRDKDDPTPLVLREAWRTISIDTKLRGDAIKNVD